ncbi:MAG: hypothetical protein ABSE53_03710 [Terracidiphilus sp.]|jgi:hypothetical protein
MSYPQRSILAALTLFFLAPFVAEYLLGDFPVTFFWPYIVLAPLYGGGALLIRELARRSHRGWPTILLLGVAYAIIEEAFTTQSLFNPDIFSLHAHLLSHGWIPALGIGAWWTLFMLNVHPFWSIGVSIALAEGLFPSRARAPWLGNVGVSVAAVLFAIGIYYNTAYSLRHDPFRASTAQFIVSALLVVVFAAAAFLIPRASRDKSATLPASAVTREPLPAPPALITGVAAFLLGAAVMLSPILWNWGAVVLILGVDLVFLIGLWLFSHRSAWTPLHTLSVGAGGALLYGAHAFMQGPVVPCPKSIALASHALFLVLAIAVVAIAVSRTLSAQLLSPQEQSPAQPL